MSAVALAGLTTGVFAGATLQRLTGVGFSLVAAPFLVLAFGAWDGVGLLYAFGTAACLYAAWQTRRTMPRLLAARLTASAMLGAVAGVLMARATSERLLGIGVATAILLACSTLVALPSFRIRDAPALQYGSGLSCGVMGGISGIGGPPLVIYGLVANVPPARLVPAMQFTFGVIGIEALAVRRLVSGDALPQLPWWVWAAMVLIVVLGDRLGASLGRFISDHTAGLLMVTVAVLGAGVLLAQSIAA